MTAWDEPIWLITNDEKRGLVHWVPADGTSVMCRACLRRVPREIYREWQLQAEAPVGIA